MYIAHLILHLQFYKNSGDTPHYVIMLEHFYYTAVHSVKQTFYEEVYNPSAQRRLKVNISQITETMQDVSALVTLLIISSAFTCTLQTIWIPGISLPS